MKTFSALEMQHSWVIKSKFTELIYGRRMFLPLSIQLKGWTLAFGSKMSLTGEVFLFDRPASSW